MNDRFSKYKETWQKLRYTAALVVVLSYCISLSSSVESSQHEEIYKTNVPENGNQSISILIANSNGNGQLQSRQIETRADDGDEGSSNSSNPNPPSESTTSDKCGDGSKCCYQYTWPGYRDPESLPAPANATCAFLKKGKDDNFACFDPIVYTEAATSTVLNTPPNFTVLATRARNFGYNVYCPMGAKQCITYTFYSRDGKKQIANQTKFCGTVTNTNTDTRITKGCHKENVGAWTREVCVCSNHLCNWASVQMSIPNSLTLLILTIVSAGIIKIFRF